MKLYQFSAPKFFPNLSPFCAKLETYLRIAGLDYETISGFNLNKNPKKLMPYIELDGQIITDSTFIIDELVRRYGDKVDNGLSIEQIAIAQAFQTMLENHFVKILVHYRWVDPDSREQFFAIAFANMPKLIRSFIGRLIGRKIAKMLYLEGTGRYSKEERLILAKKDLDAVSCMLGTKPYFFGSKPTRIDAVIFAIIGNLIYCPIEGRLKDLALKYDNLVAHSQRMLQEYYSEIK